MMAQQTQQESRRTSSRFQPGIMVNLEFGVSLSPTGRTRTSNINYKSQNMQDKLGWQHQHNEEYLLQTRSHGQIQHDYQQGPHPAPLMPHSYHNYDHAVNQDRIRQQHRSQRLGIRTREHHERGSSAPPSLTPRTERRQTITSPVSPMSGIQPLLHTASLPHSAIERPLPPLPSHFRLGEDSLPWSIEPWYQPTSPPREEEEEFFEPIIVGLDLGPRSIRRGEDPQRVRELETLHQAMMTVDSLEHDAWETWTWESVGDIPRGPRSLGWAVAQTVSPVARREIPPPPYVVSQYEESRFGGYYRPRSSG